MNLSVWRAALVGLTLSACGASEPTVRGPANHASTAGAFGLKCSDGDGPAVPARWVVERDELDAFVRESAPSAATEAWRADAAGCEHQYRLRAPRGTIHARLEQLSRTLGTTARTTAEGTRVNGDIDGMTLALYLGPTLDGSANVDIRLVHRGVDVPACLRSAISSLPPSLRTTLSLEATGASASFASIRREEGAKTWCDVHYEWRGQDEAITGKVRSWILQRGHAIDDSRFEWDDGGHGSAGWGRAIFDTRSPSR